VRRVQDQHCVALTGQCTILQAKCPCCARPPVSTAGFASHFFVVLQACPGWEVSVPPSTILNASACLQVQENALVLPHASNIMEAASGVPSCDLAVADHCDTDVGVVSCGVHDQIQHPVRLLRARVQLYLNHHGSAHAGAPCSSPCSVQAGPPFGCCWHAAWGMAPPGRCCHPLLPPTR
jgi:hypothetical protein